jgi:uncharacterized protein (DUF1501 family)
MHDDHHNLTRRQVLQYGGSAAAAAALTGVSAGAARANAPAATAVVDLTKPASPFPHVWERIVGGD